MDVKNTVTRHDATEDNVANAPREQTFAENVMGTIKVLAILGLIGAAIWGVDSWIATR